LYAWRSGSAPEAAPYRVAAVDRGAVTASVRATGTVNPVTTVLVGSQLSGQVIEILADYNSPVKAGQVMARIYAEQIKARRAGALADLEQAKADVAVRRTQVERSRATRLRADAILRDQAAQRDRAAALLAEARRNLDRQTDLTARGVGSQTALEAARTQAEIQAAALASAEAGVASQQAELAGLDVDVRLAEAQAASAEAVLLQRRSKLREVEIDLERTEIRSPVDGVVVKRDIDLGQTVAASLSAPTLFTVAQDLRRIDIWANIDEADVGRLKDGQPVTFTVNAYPNRTFDGVVRMVRLGSQTVQNVVTYTAVIGVENPDQALLPGMTANLQIVTDERRDVLRVPNAALRFRPPGVAPAPSPGLIPAAAEGGRSDGGRGPGGEGRGGGRSLDAWRERIAAELRPTPEQAAEIDRILAERRPPGREPGQSDEERRAASRAFRQETAARIAAALDPERRARFEALLQEGRGRRAGAPAAEAGSPGRVFVQGADGRPQPVALRLGATDGGVTEVLSGDLREGASVIVGGGPRPPAPAEAGPAGNRPRGPRPF
jgi:HlyD family secretion protein